MDGVFDHTCPPSTTVSAGSSVEKVVCGQPCNGVRQQRNFDTYAPN